MPVIMTSPEPRQSTKPKALKRSVVISPTQRDLQQKLAITPKTASFLLQLGYRNYRDLASASPNQIIAKLKALPHVPAKQAEWYRRPLRRMVWLGTQDEPEVQAAKTSHCSYWTIKGLTAKGLWQEGYDNLTGDEPAESQDEQLTSQTRQTQSDLWQMDAHLEAVIQHLRDAGKVVCVYPAKLTPGRLGLGKIKINQHAFEYFSQLGAESFLLLSASEFRIRESRINYIERDKEL